MNRIQSEWTENEWVVIADHDISRFTALAAALEEIGFLGPLIVQAKTSESAIEILRERKGSIVFIDQSLGTGAFRKIHAHLNYQYGERGFFIFAITESGASDFVQFAAEARIDGIIFRPYEAQEFAGRVSEVFSMKWPNRILQTPESRESPLVNGARDEEFFKRAMEKEARLGRRDPLTPDENVASVLGFKKVTHAGITPGKASFTKVRLAFKAIARNGAVIEKPFPVHALEVDENEATFECASDTVEAGDNLTIEADITHGEENHLMRIEARVLNVTGEGQIHVIFDKSNRTRFEAAMKMVAKRFKELKDFFKYAKGA